MSPNSKFDADGAAKKASGQFSWWSADHSPKQLKMNVCYGGRVVSSLWLGGWWDACAVVRTGGGAPNWKQRIERTKAPGRDRRRTRRCDLAGDRRWNACGCPRPLGRVQGWVRRSNKALLLKGFVGPTAVARRRGAPLSPSAVASAWGR